ncbi:hypothetical protein KKA13_03220 [Patescibacteria group bacterium]|nr:hypothetical protein [Patescibacteria group bacterium]
MKESRYDQSLVKPEFNVSGISDLIVLVCGIDKANFSDSNYPGAAGGELDLKEILEIGSDEEFLRRFAGSPLMRAGLEGMRRNAGIAMGNGG